MKTTTSFYSQLKSLMKYCWLWICPSIVSSLAQFDANTFESFHQRPRSDLDRSAGILYKQSLLTKAELDLIRSEIDACIQDLTEEKSSIAQNRLGTKLDFRDGRNDRLHHTMKILQDGSLFQYVQRSVIPSTSVLNSKHHEASELSSTDLIQLAPDIPVELRLYERFGSSMAWHHDDVLYDPPQFEVIFTLENTSDCRTMWKIQHHDEDIGGGMSTMNDPSSSIHNEVETAINSILLLEAGPSGPIHCVTSLRRGRRLILKCAYVIKGSQYLFGSGSNGSKMKTRKHQRRSR